MYIKVGEEEEEAQERRGGKVGQRQKRKAYERSVSRQINTTLGRNNRMGKVSLHRVCANRLMKTGRPGPCRTKVNDVINTLYRFQKGFVSSCYFFLFFFSPPSFFLLFSPPNKFDRAHVNIVPRVVAREKGRGRVEGWGHECKLGREKKFYRLSICLGKKGWTIVPLPPSPLLDRKIRRNP